MALTSVVIALRALTVDRIRRKVIWDPNPCAGSR